jgi:N-acetylneuraminic acid mutarotase
MSQHKYLMILIGLCTALAACDTAAPSDPTEPGSGSSETLSDPSLLAGSNSWTAKRSLMPARIFMAAGAINGIIYVVGGRRVDPSTGEIRVLARVDAYNVASNTWSQAASLPGPREELNGASVINGKLYVTGGRSSVVSNFLFKATKTLFVYDPRTNRWTRKADMPHAGCAGVQGVIDGQLYVYLPPVGGGAFCDGSSEMGLFFRYNPSTDTWMRRASPPSDHKDGAGRVINNRLYLAGGSKLSPCAVNGEPTFCDELSAQLDVYNPASNTWETKARLPDIEGGMAAAVLNGKLFLVGGYGRASEGALVNVDAYDPLTNRWMAKAPLPMGSHSGAAATVRGRIFYIAGTQVYAYTP